MRRIHVVILVTIVFFFILALRSVSTLLALLVEDAALDVVHSAELPAPQSTLNSSLPQLIPKIIHQTYADATIPERWRHAQETCIQLHPDYEYKFWSDTDNLAFIEREYPWFLSTFTGYAHNIQRADAIRYFILAHYGGVYLDLDNGCRRRLDPLLQFPAWLHITDPTGISNDGMGAAPRHPFFLFVIDQLQAYNRSWILPYITIMASTGPLFLSVVWKRYTAMHWKEGADWSGRVRVLTPDQYHLSESSFFGTYGGSSWHGDDARFFLWMGDHWLLTTFTGVSIGAMVIFSIYWVSGRMTQSSKLREYASLEFGSPRLPHHRGMRLFRWRSWRSHKSEPAHELVDPHVS